MKHHQPQHKQQLYLTWHSPDPLLPPPIRSCGSWVLHLFYSARYVLAFLNCNNPKYFLVILSAWLKMVGPSRVPQLTCIWMSLPTPFRSRNQISAKKWLLSEPLLFLTEDNWMTLTFCQVIILLYTSSRLTKSSTLLSTPVSISTQQVPLVVF